MNASAREQMLEHKLESHFHFVSLAILGKRIHQRDVDVSDQTKVSVHSNTKRNRVAVA